MSRTSVLLPLPLTPVMATKQPSGMRTSMLHNLCNIDVRIPLGCFVAITGVSGSGKSTLVRDILLPVLMQRIYKSKHAAGKHKKIDGLDLLDKVIDMDQS